MSLKRRSRSLFLPRLSRVLATETDAAFTQTGLIGLCQGLMAEFKNSHRIRCRLHCLKIRTSNIGFLALQRFLTASRQFSSIFISYSGALRLRHQPCVCGNLASRFSRCFSRNIVPLGLVGFRRFKYFVRSSAGIGCGMH